jgi:3-deoxy-manno-octulosonate cytidylyltransferase (CMP-KDO synthetase)
MEPFSVVIPARLGSTRLPGKVLLEIGGRPMVRHVYDRAVESGASEVIVATDEEEVAERCRGFGATVVMTGRHHRSGTDRIAEVVDARGMAGRQIVVNVQSDEPLLPPVLIRQVAQDLAREGQADMATLAAPIVAAEELFDPNVVKLVRDGQGFALYFSRAPIPWHREGFRTSPRTLPAGTTYWRHIGVYAYRVESLRRLAAEPANALELAESLEQLRALACGMRIHVTEALAPPGVGVDTPEDLSRVRALFRERGSD